MNETALTTLASGAPLPTLMTLMTHAGEQASIRFLEFFASAIRNPHTRRAYARAASDFLAWCAGAGVPSITAVLPLHVARRMTPAQRPASRARCCRQRAPSPASRSSMSLSGRPSP